jgi:hypothetical protein
MGDEQTYDEITHVRPPTGYSDGASSDTTRALYTLDAREARQVMRRRKLLMFAERSI